MRELTKVQDKIEEMAKKELANEILKLDSEFRDLIRKYNHITCDVTIKVQDKDGKCSMPYLVQLIRNEALVESIKDKYLPGYVDVMVTKLLQK